MIKVAMTSLSLCSWSFTWYKTALLEGKECTGTRQTKEITTFNDVISLFVLSQCFS